MKKSLVLAMAMALGVTASAYAANPFSDVPAGHWAYDSVNKLAAAGIVDGYGNGTFGGDRLMTRYEMAQIVAKAMAKGANVDRLAAEFADELDSLGVRVAALEKKFDNVKITGQIRYNYADYSGDLDGESNKLRSRIWLTGQINDDWKYVGMLENQQDFSNNTGDEGTNFQRAYVEGRLGGMQVSAGRQNLNLAEGNIYDSRYDGINLSYGQNVKFGAFYGKPTNIDSGSYTATYPAPGAVLPGTNLWWSVSGNSIAAYDTVYGGTVDAKIGVVDMGLGYTVFSGGTNSTARYLLVVGPDGSILDGAGPAIESFDEDDNKIWNIGFNAEIAKDLKFGAMYLDSSLEGVEGDDDGFVLGLSYKGAKASEKGSYGLYTKYYDQASTTAIAHTMNGEYGGTGFKGYMIGANYTLAKNIVAGIEYYDLDAKDTAETSMRTLWSQLVFTF